MLQAFRDFINRGNVMDLAVGIVIGAAFTQVINSFVNDIIAPLIGILTGGIDFSALAVQVGEATLAYGRFIMAIINFLVVAFALFLIVQAYNRFKKKEDQKEEVKKEIEPTQEVVLLTQIRDSLAQRTAPRV